MLSTAARDLLEDGANNIFLHQVSIWEIQIKYDKGRLPLKVAPHIYIPQALREFSLSRLQITDEAIFSLHHLSAHHRDPFDRLLISSAITYGYTLLTPDPLIHLYEEVLTLW